MNKKGIVVKVKEAGKKMKDDTIEFIEEHPFAAHFAQFGIILSGFCVGLTATYAKCANRYYDKLLDRNYPKKEQ